MIKKLVKSEEELIKLVKKELRSQDLSNNQHGSDKKELNQFVNGFLEATNIKEYPVFVIAEFNFTYSGFNYKLHETSCVLNKREASKLLESFNN